MSFIFNCGKLSAAILFASNAAFNILKISFVAAGIMSGIAVATTGIRGNALGDRQAVKGGGSEDVGLTITSCENKIEEGLKVLQDLWM